MSQAPDLIDAIARKTRHRGSQIALILLCFLPVLGSVIGRLVNGRYWLGDYYALACGAEQFRQGLSPYGIELACPGMKVAANVYAPQLGQAFASLIGLFGLPALEIAYTILLGLAYGLTLWMVVIRPVGGVEIDWRTRILMGTFLTGSAVSSGNLAILLHLMLASLTLTVPRHRWPLMLGIAVAVLIKPVFLTYAVVLGLRPGPLLGRIRDVLLAVGLGGLALFWQWQSAGVWTAAWQASLDAVVFAEQPGISLFAWLKTVGVVPMSSLSLGLYALYAVVVGVLLLVLNESLPHSLPETGRNTLRMALALLAPALLNPRLMDYDLLWLGLPVAVLILGLRRLATPAARSLVTALVALCAAVWLLNMADIDGISAVPIGTFGLMLIVCAAAVICYRHNPAPVRALFVRP